jgi:hypothetical protein
LLRLALGSTRRRQGTCPLLLRLPLALFELCPVLIEEPGDKPTKALAVRRPEPELGNGFPIERQVDFPRAIVTVP